jgi:hypothetical protein
VTGGSTRKPAEAGRVSAAGSFMTSRILVGYGSPVDSRVRPGAIPVSAYRL